MIFAIGTLGLINFTIKSIRGTGLYIICVHRSKLYGSTSNLVCVAIVTRFILNITFTPSVTQLGNKC